MKYNDMHMCGLIPPPDSKAALAWGQRPHFFVYQDRKLKFGTHKWRKMIWIYMCVNSPMNRETALAGDRRPPFSKLFHLPR